LRVDDLGGLAVLGRQPVVGQVQVWAEWRHDADMEHTIRGMTERSAGGGTVRPSSSVLGTTRRVGTRSSLPLIGEVLFGRRRGRGVDKR
jgi:hypothetical protein